MHTSSITASLSACNEKLGAYVRERRGPTVAVFTTINTHTYTHTYTYIYATDL